MKIEFCQWIATGDDYKTFYLFFAPAFKTNYMGWWDYVIIQKPYKNWELSIIRKNAIEQWPQNDIQALDSPPISNTTLMRLLFSLDHKEWMQ